MGHALERQMTAEEEHRLGDRTHEGALAEIRRDPELLKAWLEGDEDAREAATGS